jgi:putative membrane protein
VGAVRVPAASCRRRITGCYEIIEWGAAEVFGGDLGQAYLGTQGDVWDSQKDSGLMVLGTLLALAALRRRQRPQGA